MRGKQVLCFSSCLTLPGQGYYGITSMSSSSDAAAKHGAPIVPSLYSHGNSDDANTMKSTCTSTPAEKEYYNHHLVVHFDINETILVGDEAGGDTREESLHKMLSKSAFVRMMPGGEEENHHHHHHHHGVSYEETSAIVPTHWWDGTPIGKQDTTTGGMIPPLYIGWEWPKGCCPYYRTSFKKKTKTFVEHDGAPYRETLRKLKEGLHHHHHVDIPEQAPTVLGNMLPAFFQTLEQLSKTAQKKTIVFRTFGTDLPEIAQAVTAFAQGKHPDYPDFHDPRLVMTSDCIVRGRYHRNESNNGSTVYQLFRRHDNELIAAGDQEILDFIHSHTVCGIEDDYPFWKANGYQPWSGKPVWKLPKVQHILLDDNIHNVKDDSIASVRRPVINSNTNTMPLGLQQQGFESLTSDEILAEQGRHLIRVPTIAPILHPGWFLEAIDKAQASFVSLNKESSAS